MSDIGRAITVRGTISADGEVYIDGAVTGSVQVRQGTLTIGEPARLEADVHGIRILVRGAVQGSIVATERIELAATAHVTGSLSAPQVVLIDGATFNGGIDMAQRTVAAKLAAYHDKMNAS